MFLKKTLHDGHHVMFSFGNLIVLLVFPQGQMKIPVSYCTTCNWEVLNQIVTHDICDKIVIV